MKNPALLYEVSFFSALWMLFPESWKRSCPNFYAHDCIITCGGEDEIISILFLLDFFLILENLAIHFFHLKNVFFSIAKYYQT